MDDNKGKLLILAHCILNPHSKIHGGRTNEKLAKEMMKLAIDNNVGLIQLPCPEITLLGAKRWAQSYEQYDTPAYHKHCETIIEGLIDQLRDQAADDKTIIAAIGNAGSPSCGVFETSSADYSGLVPGMKGAKELPPSTRVPRQGHFIQALQRALRHHNLHVNLIELPRPDCTAEEAETFRTHIAGLITG